MTEKTTPELPFTLATSTGGMDAPITVTEVNPKGRIRLAGLSDGNLFDPAELMRNLAAFVPEVEPVGSVLPTLDRFVADMQRAAKRAGQVMHEALEPLINMQPPKGPGPLYAHPPVTAEPATAPSVCGATVGPVPKLDGERFICALATGHDGDHEAIDGTWFVDSIARYPAPSVEQIANALNSRPYGFTDGQMAKRIRDLYAGAPETPGAGPSTSDIQQIENVLSRALCDDGVKREIAEAIHALYGTPGDAGEGETWTDADGVARDFVELQGAYGEEKAARLSAEAKVRGLKRRSDGAEEREEAQRIRANEEAQSVRGLRAEVERYKAALEAADELIEAEHAWGQSKLSAQIAIDERIRREHNVARTSAAYSAARAAVEAETSEEAGDE